MDFLANIPSWDDIERNLDHKFGAINQSIDQGLQSANDGWDGMSRRVSNRVSQAYGYVGGVRIDHLQQAMALSYPIVLDDLTRKLASINITEILPVLLKLVREVVMIMGGSVAVGAGIGGAVGSLAFGAGALPGAAVGGSIGLEVGNIILMALGLASIAEYFCQGAAPCAMNLYHGVVTAWHAEDGLKPPGLDPTGGSAAMIQERTERAARQLASGQEQLVLLLLTAIVAFLMGRYSLNAMESVATRSFRLRAEITNKEFAEWLGRNEQQLLKLQELQLKEPSRLTNTEPEARLGELEQEPYVHKVQELPRHRLGEITGTYSAFELGPLDIDVAKTFIGGRYTAVKLDSDKILRRAGEKDTPLGQYFSEEVPGGVLQTRIDKAVMPEWPNGGKSPIDSAFDIKIPAGTEIYIGEVASQGGLYMDGTPQIVVIKPWMIEGVQVMGSSPLK